MGGWENCCTVRQEKKNWLHVTEHETDNPDSYPGLPFSAREILSSASFTSASGRKKHFLPEFLHVLFNLVFKHSPVFFGRFALCFWEKWGQNISVHNERNEDFFLLFALLSKKFKYCWRKKVFTQKSHLHQSCIKPINYSMANFQTTNDNTMV